MRFLLLLFFLLLPGVVFAQKDVGELIFRDIFKMADYPGAPFTGNIINDLVMFLFIPTVFIIVIITVLVLRLGLPSEKLAVLLGIAFYMFIVFGGYYSMFALLAGPYFLFLIVIMGIFVFFLGHFGIARSGGPMPGRAAGGGMPGGAVAERTESLAAHEWKRLQDIKNDLKYAEGQLAEARKAGTTHEAKMWADQIKNLRDEERRLRRTLKPWEKY